MTTAATSKPRVAKDGTVTLDGATIGRVEKETVRGLHETMLGASVSGGGKAVWHAFDATGERLSLSYGYDTRTKAVARIVKASQPLTVTDLRREHGLGMSGECVTAWVRKQGHTFGVSRYAHEEHWIVDYYSSPDSICPVFANGTGTRFTRARGLQPEIADVVTAAAVEAGVWPIRTS